MKIEKSKNIRIKTTWFAFGALGLLSSFCYFLGWDFEIKGFLVFLVIVALEFITLWALCFLLIKFNKSNYYINSESISLYKGNQAIFKLNKDAIIKIHYVRFIWILFLQMGAGYIHIEYTDETGNNKPSITFPDGRKIHSISMSLKHAKAVSKMLNKELEMK